MSPLGQVVLAGLGTYAIRVSLVALLGRVRVPAGVERALSLVAPSVMAALVAQTLVLDGGVLRAVGTWHGAALVAGVVAWYSRSIAWTLGAGMAALWLLEVVL